MSGGLVTERDQKDDLNRPQIPILGKDSEAYELTLDGLERAEDALVHHE